MAGPQPVGNTVGVDYARRELKMRGELRKGMNLTLVAETGDPDACMRYTVKAYWRDVYIRHGIELQGWPRDIVFTNLSKITGLRRISRLLELWRSGEMHFAYISATQKEAAKDNPLLCVPAPLHYGIRPRQPRSDIKKHRHRPKTNPLGLPGRYVRDGPKSTRRVTAAAELAAEREVREARLGAGAEDGGSECWSCFPCVRAGGMQQHD